MSNGEIHDYKQFAIEMMIPLLRIRQCLAVDFLLLLDRLISQCLHQFQCKEFRGEFFVKKIFFNFYFIRKYQERNSCDDRN